MRTPSPRELWSRTAAQTALVTRDVTTIFRLLRRHGYSQNKLAALTGISQPEVSAILDTRRVQAYDLMQRIFTGLAIPPCLVGMASCCTCCEHDAPTIAALAEATAAMTPPQSGTPRQSSRDDDHLPTPRGRWMASGSWIHGFFPNPDG